MDKPWLLIFDNADDPSLDVSRYFPSGNRGTALITSRNPECRIHATVGCEDLGAMTLDDSVTLLLTTSMIKDRSELIKTTARKIVETLGCLALAIIQASAVIRLHLCPIEDYCVEFRCQSQRLLSHSAAQASSDYEYTVVTMWEISIDKIQKMAHEVARNALKFLDLFAFLHFEGITEDILHVAWAQQHHEKRHKIMDHLKYIEHLAEVVDVDSDTRDPFPFRQAISLLSSFSLIKIEEKDDCISMHPLVHKWARDRLTHTDSQSA